jgi:hypothetical protein
VSDKPAGWYPDPDGEQRQRYWDGDSWTDYYTPLPPERAEIHGSATALADYPYLTATKTGSHHGLMTPPTGVARQGGWPTAPAPAAEPGETQEFGNGRSSATRWAMVAASILVVGLVAGLLWWAFGGEGGEDPTAGPDPSGTAQPTDGPTNTGTLTLGETASAEVPAGGLWVGSLDLGADTTFLIDARGDSSSDDLRIVVQPEGGGDAVAGSDDRGNYLAAMGGNALNPFVVATLPAGIYEVTMDNRTGEDTVASVAVTAVTEEIGVDVGLDATVPNDGAWAGLLTVPADAEYRIDITGLSADDGDTPDPVLVAFGPDEEQLVNDDRGQDQPNPLLEQQLVAGTWVVLVTDWRGRGIDVAVDISLLS